MAKHAKDLMTQNPACITPQTTVQEAASLMETEDVGSLPVVESRDTLRLIGIVTDRDLALRVLGRGLPGSTTVRDAMSSGNLACARRDDSLDDVEDLMGRHQVRRIPVVDDNNCLLGVIAQADLARERRAVGDKDFAKVVEKISEPSSGLR